MCMPLIFVRCVGPYEIAGDSWDVETHPIECASLHLSFLLIFFGFPFRSFIVSRSETLVMQRFWHLDIRPSKSFSSFLNCAFVRGIIFFYFPGLYFMHWIGCLATLRYEVYNDLSVLWTKVHGAFYIFPSILSWRSISSLIMILPFSSHRIFQCFPWKCWWQIYFDISIMQLLRPKYQYINLKGGTRRVLISSMIIFQCAHMLPGPYWD